MANSCNYPQQRWRTVAIIHNKGGEQLQLSTTEVANSCNSLQKWRTVAITHSKGSEQLQLPTVKVANICNYPQQRWRTVAITHSEGGEQLQLSTAKVANSCNYPQQRWRTVAIIHSIGGEQLQLSTCKGDVKSSVLTKNDNRTELAWTRVTEHPLTQRTHIIKCPFLVY